MELIILLAVILSASIIESMISTVLKPREPKHQEGKIRHKVFDFTSKDKAPSPW